MGFWALVAMWAISYVAAEALRPKPDIQEAKRASLGDFQFPTATQGRVVPLLWGTMKVKGPNVVWYGDLKQKAFTRHVDPGLFGSTKEYVVGYRYFLGVQFALCRGTVDKLLRVWVGDDLVWDTGQTGAGTITINKPNLFGGSELGNGGITGNLDFLVGDNSQVANTYLSDFQKEPAVTGDTPAYRGTCYCVWKQGWLGNSTQIKPWAFELQRLPNQLGMSAGKHIVNTYDANPMCMAYEIMTDTDWGMGIDPADIDTAGFITFGNTLYDEVNGSTKGNGISLMIDRPIEAGDLLIEIQEQCDCVFYFDPLDQKWKVNPIRGGYDIDTIPQLNDATVNAIEDFSRSTWEQSTNAVRISFSNREIDYGEDFALAQDQAMFRQQNVNIPSTRKYIGVKDATLANSLAWRDLRSEGVTMSKATVKVDRAFWGVAPGDPVALQSDTLGLNKAAYRVIKIDGGDPIDDTITLYLLEDFFEFAVPSFGDPGGTGWSDPEDALVVIPASDQVAMEAPRAITVRDPDGAGANRVWTGGITQGNEAQIIIRQRNSSGTPTGAYYDSGELNNSLLKGKLQANISAENGTSTVYILADQSTLDEIEEYYDAIGAITSGDIGSRLANLIYVTTDASDDPDPIVGEFMAFESFDVLTSPDRIRLNNTHRGLLDTVPQTYSTNDPVYFMVGGLAVTSFSQGNNVDIKLIPKSTSDELLEASALVMSVTSTEREVKPYPPAAVQINSADFPSTTSIDTNYGTDDEDGIRFTFNRRDFRILDEIVNIENDAADINSDFPTANMTEYQLEIIEDPGVGDVSLFTTAWDAASVGYIDATRTEILRNNAGVVPSRLRAEISVRHQLGGTQISLQKWTHDFDISASELDNDFLYGVLDHDVTSSARTITASTAGTHTFTLPAAIAGDVEYQLNTGGWLTLITAGGTSGSVVGLIDTDILEIRHKDTATGTIMTFLRCTNPSTADAYAILYN